MKKNVLSVLVSITLLLFTAVVSAANQQLMTARDRAQEATFSNVTIQNKTGASITATGLYINQLAYTGSGATCSGATVLYPGVGDTPNMAGGAFVTAIPFTSNQKVPVGQNFLYNMIYTNIYFSNQQPSCGGGGCAPCTLPGCSWFTDPVPYKWCVYVGVLSPRSGNTISSGVPPYGYATSGSGYNYGMVNQYGYIGPISCNDETQTCLVSTAQNVAFPQ